MSTAGTHRGLCRVSGKMFCVSVSFIIPYDSFPFVILVRRSVFLVKSTVYIATCYKNDGSVHDSLPSYICVALEVQYLPSLCGEQLMALCCVAGTAM